MEELIWFSMPGAVLAATIVTVWPTTANTEPQAVIWLFLVPAIGFIVHQFYRLIFEMTGGYARKSRAVLQYIISVLAPREDIVLSDLKKAFLVWEITFYGEHFPAAFRDHNRGAWHYIMSFWSISLSGILSFLLAVIGFLFVSRTSPVAFVATAELCIALIFYLKGRTTYHSLIKQEVALAHSHGELFLTTLRQLEGMQ